MLARDIHARRGDVTGIVATLHRIRQLKDEPRFVEAVEELRPLVDERGEHTPEFGELWDEMTSVRRSIAGATW